VIDSTDEWRYQPGGPRISPRVRKQLQSRRDHFWHAWKRDPGREVALLVILVACLGAIYVLSLSMKQHWFDASGTDPAHSYWMESAQRFRYVRMVADGGWIPEVDRRMQAPDGYAPWSDTVLQEVLYGTAYQHLADPEEELAPFVRRFTRAVSATSVFGVALLCFGVTRRRDAAVFGALVWAVALPVVERGTGAVLFREDLAVPALLLHLGFLALWARRTLLPWAVLSGVFLALSLLLWKVVTFYVLLLLVFLATAWLLRREDARELLIGTVLLFLPVAGACALPLSLRHDSFLTSTPMLGAAALIAGMTADVVATLKAKRDETVGKGPWVWLPVAVVVFVALRVLLPGEAGYSHAWETIVAKVRYLGVKPSDPSVLSFHARHYWTGNYNSPTLLRLARDWPFLLLAAGPGLWATLKWWRPGFLRTFRIEDQVPPAPPRALLAGYGPTEPLLGLASHLVLWMLFGFGGVYLLFRKLQLLAAIPLVVLAALGFCAFVRRRTQVRIGLVVALLLVAAHGRALLPDYVHLMEDPEKAGSWLPVVTSTPESFDDLARALPELAGPDEPVLASFVISPFILAYLDRPTVLHCFFEGDLLTRLEEITLARFGSEDELWEVATRYGARWYVHEAQHVLRTDPSMSQRYVADEVDAWPHTSVVITMQYAPRTLRRFELAYENDWYRVFRVLDEGERPRHTRDVDATRPAWSRGLFKHLFGDPLKPLDQHARHPVTPTDLLYSTLWAQRSYARGGFTITPRFGGDARAERQLQEAARVAPYLVAAQDDLARYYRAIGRPDRSAQRAQAARAARNALAGSTPSVDMTPVPISLVE